MTAVPSTTADHHPSPRDRHLTLMAAQGRLGWQEQTGYRWRSFVATAMGTYKTLIGPGMRTRPARLTRRRPTAWLSSIAWCMRDGPIASAVAKRFSETIE